MERIKVSDLKPKQDITSVFMLKYIAIMSAKDGKKYLNVILCDATGDLESRVWTNAEDIYQKFDRGQFVRVQGKVNLYQGRKQFIIQEIEPVDASDVDEAENIHTITKKLGDKLRDGLSVKQKVAKRKSKSISSNNKKQKTNKQ